MQLSSLLTEIQDLLTSLVEVLTTNQYQMAEILKCKLAVLIDALISGDKGGAMPYREADAELLLGEQDVEQVLEEFVERWMP